MNILKEYGIEQDPRLKRAFREFLIAIGFCIVYSVVTLSVAWSIGMSKPAQEYTYIFGFPAWFFWGIIFCPLAFFLVAILIVTLVFKDVDLVPWLNGGQEGRDK